MARQIIRTQQNPLELEINGEMKRFCMCGLSKNFPFCDESHLVTQDEMDGVLYVYDENNNKIVAYDMNETESEGCCGGGCCGNGGCCGESSSDEE